MTQTFTVQISDEKQRRIPINKAAWDLENLKKGDYVEVTVKKIEQKK